MPSPNNEQDWQQSLSIGKQAVEDVVKFSYEFAGKNYNPDASIFDSIKVEQCKVGVDILDDLPF